MQCLLSRVNLVRRIVVTTRLYKFFRKAEEETEIIIMNWIRWLWPRKGFCMRRSQRDNSDTEDTAPASLTKRVSIAPSGWTRDSVFVEESETGVFFNKEFPSKPFEVNAMKTLLNFVF